MKIPFATLAVFIAATCMLLAPSLLGLSIFDEGAIATGSIAVMRGALPYRDFFSPYGPGQFFLDAVLFKALSVDLVIVRIQHALVLGAMVAAAYVLAKRFSDSGSAVAPIAAALAVSAALVSHPTAGYPALPAAALLMCAAIAVNRAGVDRSPPMCGRQVVYASILVGLAGLFRWDFGAFGFTALWLAWLLVGRLGGASWLTSLSGALVACLPGVAIMAVVYMPLLAMSPPARWVEEVLWYVLFEMPKWRDADFVRPLYWQLIRSLETSDTMGIFDAVFRGVFLVLPPILSLFALVTFGRRAIQGGRIDARNTTVVYLGVVVLLLLNQMRVRPSLWQGLPAFVVSLPLLALIREPFLALISNRSPFRVPVWSALAIVVTAFIAPATLALIGAFDKREVTLALPRATAVRVSKDEAADYSALVRYVVANSVPGEAVFSGVTDHTRLLVNDVMLYFLTDRQSATRYAELAPGIANTVRGQKEIIDGLQAKRVNLIILLELVSNEANLTSKGIVPNTLDVYLREYYLEAQRFGRYIVMNRRPDRVSQAERQESPAIESPDRERAKTASGNAAVPSAEAAR